MRRLRPDVGTRWHRDPEQIGPGAPPTKYWRLRIPDRSPSPLAEGEPTSNPATAAALKHLAFSPDGEKAAYRLDDMLVVTPADDVTVVLIEIEAPGEVGGVSGRPIWSSRDVIAFATANGVDLLDLASGHVTTLVSPGTSRVDPLAFSPDGDRLLYAQNRGSDTAQSRCGASTRTVQTPTSSSAVLPGVIGNR